MAFVGRSPRFFATTLMPPRFIGEKQNRVRFSKGIGKSALDSFTVTVPAAVVPPLVAACTPARMGFPGCALPIAAVAGLLVAPLQPALIPRLKPHNSVGIGREPLGIWLAHAGFGLPLAICLLRNHIAGLPREISRRG